MCPEDECQRTLGSSLIKSVSSYGEFAKYTRFVIRSYVDDNRNIKWCPTANCNYAIALKNHESIDVECSGLHRFCWEVSGICSVFCLSLVLALLTNLFVSFVNILT